MIIAIDGPAASGKGTIARQLASVYGLHHLDTGILYRAVAKAVLDAGRPPDDATQAIAAAITLDPATFDESALKAQKITEAASVVAAIPEVRQALMNYQREFATRPPGRISSQASSNVSGTPTASNATSAPAWPTTSP